MSRRHSSKGTGPQLLADFQTAFISTATIEAAKYEATIEDPETFTRPWTIRMPLYRHIEPDARLLEFNCVKFSEELLYGKFMSRDAVQPAESP